MINENSQKNNNPHSYRGLNCKSQPDTDNCQTASSQKSDIELLCDELLAIDDEREKRNNWHKFWNSWRDRDGLYHIGLKNMPFVEVKRGFEFFVHGYRATIKKVMTDGEFFKLFASLKQRYGGDFALQSGPVKSGVMWQEVFANADGVRIYRNRKTESVNDIPEYHAMIEVDGRHCESKSLYNVCNDIVWLHCEMEFKLTRVDPKVRDCESRVTIEELEAWRDSGRVRGVRKFKRTQGELFNHTALHIVIPLERTVDFGKRIGNKYVRVYEPFHLHHVSGLDWEVEYKGSLANDFVKKLSDCIERCRDDKDIPFQFFEMYVAREFIKVIADSVFSAVNFIELNGKNRNYDRLPEYQALIDAVFSDINKMPVTFYTPTKLKAARPPIPTIATKITWLFKQVAPTLKAVINSFDTDSQDDFIRILLEDGEDRMSRFKRALSKQGFDIPPDIEGELRRLEVMDLLPAV